MLGVPGESFEEGERFGLFVLCRHGWLRLIIGRRKMLQDRLDFFTRQHYRYVSFSLCPDNAIDLPKFLVQDMPGKTTVH